MLQAAAHQLRCSPERYKSPAISNPCDRQGPEGQRSLEKHVSGLSSQ